MNRWNEKFRALPHMPSPKFVLRVKRFMVRPFSALQKEAAVIRVLRAKLHGLRVTGADLHYHGSITLDPEHCAAAGLHPTEFVDVWNKNSGARLTTYVIYGDPGSRCCVLNGAAARTCQEGDELILAASCEIEPANLYSHQPRILTFAPGNEIDQKLQYDVFKSDRFEYDFRITDLGEPERPVSVHNYANVDLKAIRSALEEKGLERDAIDAFVARYLTR
jgi:aspartate 1-decarboxylase